MVAETHVYACPHCHQTEPIVRFGYNRCGTRKLRCKACVKVFTPAPKSRALTPEKEILILDALAERLSLRAIARLHHVTRSTVTTLLEKKRNNSLP